MLDQWTASRNEQARQRGGKVTPKARQRMQRTAREQLADALQASRAPVDLPEPDDSDDASAQRGVLM